MKLAVFLLVLATVAYARNINLEDVIELEKTGAYNYMNRIGIPLAEKIRKAEEEARKNPSRIFNGSPAVLGQFPYQAALLTTMQNGFVSYGGAVLLSSTRVLTAAHNWNDGASQGTTVTVVLGTVYLFTGGTRLPMSSITIHENYSLFPLQNDIAMINLPSAVSTSSVIAPIALPSGTQLNEDFVGDNAVASGFGMTTQTGGIVNNPPLNFVNLPVISNAECMNSYGASILPSTVCTSGATGNICVGDSGGPLAVTRNNLPLLIGITSFGAGVCQAGMPSGFTRVTYYINWINNLL